MQGLVGYVWIMCCFDGEEVESRDWSWEHVWVGLGNAVIVIGVVCGFEEGVGWLDGWMVGLAWM